MRIAKLLFVFVILLFRPSQGDDNTYLPHSEAEGDPSGIVASCVNVIRGTFSHHSTDILIPGAEPLTMRRSYVSGNWLGSLCENWTYDHVHEAIISNHSSYYKFIIPEMTGGAANYVSSMKYTGVENILTKKISIDVPQKSCDASQRIVALDAGLTNLGTDEIGGHTNLKNQNVSYDA